MESGVDKKSQTFCGLIFRFCGVPRVLFLARPHDSIRQLPAGASFESQAAPQVSQHKIAFMRKTEARTKAVELFGRREFFISVIATETRSCSNSDSNRKRKPGARPQRLLGLFDSFSDGEKNSEPSGEAAPPLEPQKTVCFENTPVLLPRSSCPKS